MQKFLLVLLAGSLALPSAAQTGRIAHFSHGGSAATLAAREEDNFGIVPQFVAEEIRRVSDSTAIMSGYAAYEGSSHKLRVSEQPVQFTTRNQHVEPYGAGGMLWNHDRVIQPLIYLQRKYPRAVFIGFEGLSKRELKKRLKKGVGYGAGEPRLPGGWLALSGLVLLAGAGWLGGRSTPRLTAS